MCDASHLLLVLLVPLEGGAPAHLINQITVKILHSSKNQVSSYCG